MGNMILFNEVFIHRHYKTINMYVDVSNSKNLAVNSQVQSLTIILTHEVKYIFFCFGALSLN